MGNLTRRAFPWLVLAGILVAALSLRSPIIALTPVLPDIIVDLGISSAAAGMLTTAPVIMFAVLTPFAALLIRRSGAEIALLLSLGGVLLGTFVRALPGFGSMLTGMFIMGAAITIGNVVIPVIIRRDLPPERTAIATAAYTATLNVGSLITALGTVPLAAITGWSLALLLWSVFTVAGIGLWIVHIVRSRAWNSAERVSGEPTRSKPSDAEAEAITGPMPVVVDTSISTTLRRPIVWLLLAAFGSQSAIYYATSTWLPTIVIDTTQTDATTAGALASLFQGVAIVGAMLAPALLRYVGAVPSAVLMGACFVTMVLGMLFAPDFAGVWAAVGAIAHSSGFVLIFTGLIRVSHSASEAATMSALVQGGGYVLAALGAPLLGVLHESTGEWQIPLVAVLVVALVYTTALVSAMFTAFRRA